MTNDLKLANFLSLPNKINAVYILICIQTEFSKFSLVHQRPEIQCQIPIERVVLEELLKQNKNQNIWTKQSNKYGESRIVFMSAINLKQLRLEQNENMLKLDKPAVPTGQILIHKTLKLNI